MQQMRWCAFFHLVVVFSRYFERPICRTDYSAIVLRR